MKHNVVVSLLAEGRLITAQPFCATTFLGDALTELLLNREPQQIIVLKSTT